MSYSGYMYAYSIHKYNDVVWKDCDDKYAI